MGKKKDGSYTGNKAVMARIPDELRAAFNAKCKELKLNQADCLRLAIKEFSAKK